MVIILVLAGAIFGGMVFQSLGGVIAGGLFGVFANWVLTLSRRLDAVQDQLAALDKRLRRLGRDIEAPEEPARETAPGPRPPKPAEKPAAARAVPDVAKTVSAPPSREVGETVPPAAPIPPKPVVPPAGKVPPSKVSRPAAATEPAPRAMTLPPRRRGPEPEGPTFLDNFLERWIFGGNPLVKIGAVVLFLGLAFALRYAAQLGLLPLWVRYAGVAATGVALIVFGWRWRDREDNYGLVLQGTGVGVLYLTTLAAMKLHPLLPLGAGFVLLVLIAAFAALLAIKEKAMVLAVVAALGGFAAPVLASTGAGNHVVLFSYLTVLNLGILAIAWFERWRVLNILGYVCSFGLGSTWAARHYREELFWSVEPFLLLLFGVYVLITVLFARRTLADEYDDNDRTFRDHLNSASRQVKYVDGPLAFGVPFSAFWVQHLLVQPYQYGTAFSAMAFAAFYFLLAFVLIRGAGKRYVLLNETLIALGAVFGTLSIPLLETQWTSAAWAIEAAGVYWIGYRQRQLHVRLFALLVLLGSAIFFLPELRLAVDGTVLDGPVLGAALLAASTGFAYWLMRQGDPDRLYGFERDLRPIVVGFGAVILATLPLLLLSREWSAATLAILGAGFIFLSRRLSDRALLGTGWVYQAAGGALFLSTLEAADFGAVLADGWLGLLWTCLIGAAMLAGAVILAPRLFTVGQREVESDTALPVGAALLAGLAFINLAPLFVLSWRMSAVVWPVIGIATLVWAVRVRHTGVLMFSLALQLIAGYFHLRTWVVGDVTPVPAHDAAAFAHSGFLGPLVIALAGLVCAWLLHRDKSREYVDDGLGWIAVGWGGLWWAFAWAMEVTRVVPGSGVTATLIAVAIATAWAWSLLSQRLDWPQLGQAALAYLPVLVILGARDVLVGSGHPGAGWGALAWPAALLAHGLLLRRPYAAAMTPALGLTHTVGAWLFVVLASLEVRWWLVQWAPPATAWPLLGAMLIPAAFVWLVARQRVLRAWPVRDFFVPYVVTAALPLCVFLLGWLWVTNVASTGDARPLPYVPLLNPLELAYLAVLAGVFLWWRLVRDREPLDNLDALANPVLAGTAFAAVTGGVLRACHHWAGVSWDADALYASDTVQASLSVVWGTLAISLMLFGNRRKLRTVWIIGTVLVGVVVLKLFLIELSAVGTLQRIVSFIVVGLLLLLVGYVAPLPPRREKTDEVR